MINTKEHLKPLTDLLIRTISETNGISLANTLELMMSSTEARQDQRISNILDSFIELIFNHRLKKITINELLSHPFSKSLFSFFKLFPIKYHEEHVHLTGSLSPEFIHPRLMKLLDGANGGKIKKNLVEIYGPAAENINSPEDIEKLICLAKNQQFHDYLKILYLPKLILTDRKTHFEAAHHMAQNLYENFNIGRIRLKFTLSRATNLKTEKIDGLENLSEEDVIMGLYEGFMSFKKEHPDFDFVLSPCFRKESNFFDSERFSSKKDHFEHQIDEISAILEKHPELVDYLRNIDTVGDEKSFFKKEHFMEMKHGLRRLQYKGFQIRGHHGESWRTLSKGVQSVDNAVNIWRIDALEHGISLGINPNYYFHGITNEILRLNKNKSAIRDNTLEYNELMDLEWHDPLVRQKLLGGTPLNEKETTNFIKSKFHTAMETEQYQHDVLNHMINKDVALIALPTSNLKLTGRFHYYKDHPFSWWEKKGVRLGIGTDNYVTLGTNYIKELLTLLYSDPEDLKITKLLIVGTREKRRPYISNLLWKMRKNLA
ncbi:MAG: hypothetical protein KAQ98_03835 [Bacteriovoracaceae bacterium]|nr:hypothetical protein [Bacteriovoracaceae bacterium]